MLSYTLKTFPKQRPQKLCEHVNSVTGVMINASYVFLLSVYRKTVTDCDDPSKYRSTLLKRHFVFA